MLSATCDKCQRSFPLKDAELDPNWNRFSLDPLYVYCPHCKEKLEGVDYRSVDLARTITLRNALLGLVVFSLFGIGVFTETLAFLGPIMIAVMGLWLATTSRLRDHKIIGWLLLILAAGILVVLDILST